MSADSPGSSSSPFPPNFETWPRSAQIEHVGVRMTRKGLIAHLLARAHMPAEDYELRDDSKLRKKELAAIYLKMEGIDYESE